MVCNVEDAKPKNRFVPAMLLNRAQGKEAKFTIPCPFHCARRLTYVVKMASEELVLEGMALTLGLQLFEFRVLMRI